MKSKTSTNTPTVSNDRPFTIAASSAAFRILSDGLYSDKAKAVIRELSCNAYDSHVAAGKADTPFEMHLPTNLEPWFSISDFGTGISDADIYNIYTSYFTSTKSNSNDFIGQLGLGSKSPFCMVSSFIVTSSHAGIESQYQMHFDANDVPRVTKLASKANAAVTGLTIKFDVNPADHEDFYRAAHDVLSWFVVKPVQIGYQTPYMPDRSVTNSAGRDWYMLSSKHDVSAKALMGNVAYQLDAQSITGLSESEANLLALPIVIVFNIGDLEVAASRETIAYDARTIANLVTKVKQVTAEYICDIKADIAGQPTEWAARNRWDKLFNTATSHNGYYLRLLCADQQLEWNGIPINSDRMEIDLAGIYGVQNSYPVMTGNRGKIHYKTELAKTDPYTISARDISVIVIDDLARGGKSRVRAWLKTTYCASSLNGWRAPDSPTHVFALPSGCSVDQLVAQLKHVPNYKLTSSMPAVQTGGAKSTFAANSMFVLDGNWSWKPAQVDLEKGGFYVTIRNREIVSPEGKTFSDAGSLVKRFLALDHFVNPMGGITALRAFKPAVVAKIKQMPQWRNMFDMLRERVEEVLLDQTVMQQFHDVKSWKQRVHEYRVSFERNKYKLEDPNGSMSKMIAHNERMQQLESSAEYKRAAKAVEATTYFYAVKQVMVELEDPKVVALWDEFKRRYPLLPFVPRYYDNEQAVNDYINIIDQHYVWYALSKSDIDTAE